MSEIDYEARVAKGIALLDEKVPDWVGRIDLEELNVGSETVCVTAQVSGVYRYDVGMRMLGLELGDDNDGSYTLHGFNTETSIAPGMPDAYDPSEAMRTLNAIWRREIGYRQSPDRTRSCGCGGVGDHGVDHED